MSNNEDQLRYPIGKFVPKESYTSEERSGLIRSIRELPAQVEETVRNFTEKQWSTTYRDGGWTARQVVHHLADSHMNAYIRIKWALTEEGPVIKAYDEKRWAETPEVALDTALSIALLSALHAKWVTLLKHLDTETLKRYFIHPDTQKQVSLERMLGLYSWHGEHHLGHLKIISSKA